MKKIVLALTFLSSASVFAQTAVKVASSNATIDSGGPSGTPWWHNAQVPGTFESYGISSFSFTAGDFGLPNVTGISVIEISYMQSNAGFTTDGPLEIFVSFDTTVAGGSYAGLTHSGSGAGIDDSQFSDSPSMQSLGSQTFTEVADGTVDTYTLNLSTSLENSILNAINNGNAFSLILGAPSGSTAATYAGIESNDYVGNGGTEPDSKMTSLSITAVPEPEFYGALFGLLALGFAVARRRRHQS